MSQRTPRFGFQYFGGAVDGAFSDNGQKYTSADRMAMDRILAVLEQNSLHLVSSTAAAGTPLRPTATLGMSGGSLPSGQTFFYRLAWVDANGLESIAGGEVSISTPPPLEAPIAPLLFNDDADAGILGQGLYYYGLTALSDASAFPDQSALGPVAAATLGPDVTALSIALPDDLPEGAQLFAAWRLGPNEAGFTRIGTGVPGEVIKDQGAVPPNPNACDPGQAPPMQSETVARYSVTITLDDVDKGIATDLDSRTVTAWRLYRAQAAGAYSGNSLVAEVTASADEPIPTSWIDEGDPLSVGGPSVVDMRMNLRPYVFDHATDALPDPALYPEFYPLISDGSLYAKIGGSWTQVGGGGGGGSSIMTAPDGKRWRLTVGNDGTLSTIPTPEPGPPTPPLAP